MGYNFDKEAVKQAGGRAYSKYGRVRNSKDLRPPREIIEKMDFNVKLWICRYSLKTVALEEGEDTVWEEFLENFPMNQDAPALLRICKMLDKKSAVYKKNMGILYDCRAIPWCSGIDRYLIYVSVPRTCNGREIVWSSYPWDRQLAEWANAAEEKCDKQKILDIMMGKSKINPGVYLTPWKRWYLHPKGEPWEDIMHTYPSEVRSRILEMYLDIADMDEVSPGNKYQLRRWAADKLVQQPYVSDKARGFYLYSTMKENDAEANKRYILGLSNLIWERTEESVLVLKRLESYDIPEVIYGLGIKYLEGLGCERDYQEARRYFVKGKSCDSEEERQKCAGMVSYATRKADSYEFFKIAMKKLESEQFEEGIARLEKLAEEEDLEEAQVELARLLETGYKIKKDEERAMKNYERAAEAGNIEAIKKVIQKLEKEYSSLIFRDGYSYKRETIRNKLSKLKYCLENTYQKDYKTK